MIIELMACMGCQRIVDQFTFPASCPRCMSKFHKAVNPSKWVIFKWFLAHPKHVLKLIIEDIREKYRGNKARS